MLLRTSLCAFLVGAFLSLSAQNNDEQVLIQSQSLQSANIKSVEAKTDNGNISVEGVDAQQARVEVYAWSEDADEKVKREFTELYELDIQTNGGKLTVTCKQKNRNRRSEGLSISFRLFVPAGASTELVTSGGNLHCKKLSGGTQQVMTSGGNIAFEDVKGKMTGKTSGGNISVVGCSESVEAITSGGNISAETSKGSLTLVTSGGNLSLQDLSGEIKAETSGGNIAAEKITGTLHTSSSGGNLSLENLSCALDAETAGGHLHVSISKVDRFIKLKNDGSGNTELQLPLSTGIDLSASGRSVRVNDGRGFTGDMSEREVKGKLGGGGLPVTIDGGDSRVVITLK